MLNLIKLELKKNKFNGNIRSVAIISAVISLIFGLMYFEEITGGEVILLSYQDYYVTIDLLVRATYIVYAAALLAKFVIAEYKSKTMQIMFTYPVSRRKLIFAKLIIVGVWTFLAIVVTNVIVTGVFLMVDSSFHRISDSFELSVLGNHGLKMLVQAIAAAGMSLIPLVFGMIKKSIITTIVSSIIIVSAINAGSEDFTLSGYIAIPVSLALIGVAIAYLSFRNIDKVDLL